MVSCHIIWYHILSTKLYTCPIQVLFFSCVPHTLSYHRNVNTEDPSPRPQPHMLSESLPELSSKSIEDSMFQVALSLQDLIEVIQYDLFKEDQAHAAIRHEPLFQAPIQCLDFPHPHTGRKAATKVPAVVVVLVVKIKIGSQLTNCVHLLASLMNKPRRVHPRGDWSGHGKAFEILFTFLIPLLEWKRENEGEKKAEQVSASDPHHSPDSSFALSVLLSCCPEPYRMLKLETERLVSLITTRSSSDGDPCSREARRRLLFLVNSVFMDMPKLASIQNSVSFSVLTPYYAEDVIYSINQVSSLWLRAPSEGNTKPRGPGASSGPCALVALSRVVDLARLLYQALVANQCLAWCSLSNADPRFQWRQSVDFVLLEKDISKRIRKFPGEVGHFFARSSVWNGWRSATASLVQLQRSDARTHGSRCHVLRGWLLFVFLNAISLYRY